MEDLRKVKRFRAGFKASITKLTRDLDLFLHAANAQEKKAKYNTIKTLLIKIEANNDNIYELLKDEELEDAMGEDAIYVQQVNEILVQLETSPEPPKQAKRETGFKLPKLNLLSFSGEVTKWVEFWGIFECSIHQNKELTDIQKLTYLKSQLEGEAAKLVSGFKLEACNYGPAIQLLKDNYGRKDRVSYALVTELTNLPKPTHNVSSLKQFTAKYESLYKSLVTQDLNRGEICSILLLNYLPAQTKENIKRALKEEMLDIEKVLECLRNELFTMEGDSTSMKETNHHTIDTFNVGQTEREKRKPQCKLCYGTNHPWFKCRQYPNPESRVKRAQTLRLCKGCLDSEHGKKGCTNPKIQGCKFCEQKHYHALCLKPKEKDKGKRTSEAQTLTLTTPTERTILPTVMLPMMGKGGVVLKQRALLDQCSQKTFVLKSQLTSLKHSITSKETLRLQGFTGSRDSQEYDVASLYYKYKGKEYPLKAVVVDQMPKQMAHKGLTRDLQQLRNMGCRLADPNIQSNTPISLLIGGDYYYDLVHPGYERQGSLILLPTICGFALSGTHKNKEENTQVEVISVLKVAVSSLEEKLDDSNYKTPKEDLNKLWELDHIGILPNEITQETKDTMEQFEQSITYNTQTNQYSVCLPWKNNKSQLPSNFNLALGRLRSLQHAFIKNPDYYQQYSKVIAEQVDRNFIERVDPRDDPPDVHYLPHHGVKKDSLTTPIRVVYDCSAKQAPCALSLNDCLVTGPSLVPDLAHVLLRFRHQRYAFISDIEKAFLMVGLNEADRNYTRFFWPKDPLNINSPFDIYRFKVVLFGSTCSQYLLNATIAHHLSNIQEQENITNIKKGLYIDNLQGTSNKEEDLLEQYWEIQRIFNKAHLYLRGWVTNSPKLQEQLKVDEVMCRETAQTKVLGLIWNPSSDTLTFKFSDSKDPEITKRSCLSMVSKLFDPLGLLTPVVIKSRIFLQGLWKLKISWDQMLSDELCQEWNLLEQELKLISNTKVPRAVTIHNKADLHIFSDASSKAYGACAYLCSEGQAILIMGKAKVAPLKDLTIPKLELTAVLLASRLNKFLHEAYKNTIDINNTYLWCDSQITLYWLQSEKPLPIYVANRVREINNLIPGVEINYVTTRDNPADLLTRGINAAELDKNALWWQGPPWVPHQHKWPKLKLTPPMEVSTLTNTVTPPTKIIEWEKYSSYDKCLRIVAWICRYKSNLYKRIKGLAINTDSVLNAREIKTAELEINKLVQREGFSKEYTLLTKKADRSSYTDIMLNLGLYLENNLIRCGGRIHTTKLLPEATKHPILLPSRHHLTKLLIHKCHETNHHYGVNSTVAYLRQKWWVPKIRQSVKGVLRNCNLCKKYQGNPYSPSDVPPLPDFRTNIYEPFTITGVDFTGALKVKGENSSVTKAYIVLFTCATTRAIHLDLVSDLTSQNFLNALKRFTSRQGLPQVILSDNATTFVNTASYLEDLKGDPHLNNHLASINCEWKFIPARAPWFGAIWERLIGILKTGLKKILGRALVTFDELHTILIELEATINDRPLTYVNSDLNEFDVLTPSQLLRGRRLKAFPHEQSVDEITDPSYNTSSSLRERVNYINKLLKDLWKRWTSDYLLSLRESHKCLLAKENKSWPRVGDIVLIHDDGPRSKWKLGKITGLHMGRDGIIRVADLKTPSGSTTRPVVRLYPLEQSLEDESTSIATNPQGHVCHQRPLRKAATRSADLWQSKIKSGQL